MQPDMNNNIDNEIINQLIKFGYNKKDIINAISLVIDKNDINEIAEYIDKNNQIRLNQIVCHHNLLYIFVHILKKKPINKGRFKK